MLRIKQGIKVAISNLFDMTHTMHFYLDIS